MSSPLTLHNFYQCIHYILNKEQNTLTFENNHDERLNELITQHQLQLTFINLLPKNTITIKNEENLVPLLIQRHLVAKKHLIEIVKILNIENIPYVILKGIPLNQQLYQNRCIRLSSDIDLLIRPSDLEATHYHLLTSGYQLCSEFTPEILKTQHKKIFIGLKDLTYIHSKSQIKIELHWGTTITHQFGFNFIDISEYRQLIFIENTGIYI